MKSITRRNLVMIAAALPAAGQQPAAAPATPDDELKSARQNFRSAAEQLAKVKLPMATEPATRFKA